MATEAEALALFKSLDVNNDGRISLEELKSLCRQPQYGVSVEQPVVQEIVQENTIQQGPKSPLPMSFDGGAYTALSSSVQTGAATVMQVKEVDGSTKYKETYLNEGLHRIIERNAVGDAAQTTTIKEPVTFVTTAAAVAPTRSDSRAKVTTDPQVVNQPMVEAVFDDRMKKQVHSVVEAHLAFERVASNKAMDAHHASQAHQLDLLVSNKINEVHGLVVNLSASCEERFKEFETERRQCQQDLQQFASQFGQMNLNRVWDAVAMQKEIHHLKTTLQNLQEEMTTFVRKQMSEGLIHESADGSVQRDELAQQLQLETSARTLKLDWSSEHQNVLESTVLQKTTELGIVIRSEYEKKMCGMQEQIYEMQEKFHKDRSHQLKLLEKEGNEGAHAFQMECEARLQEVRQMQTVLTEKIESIKEEHLRARKELQLMLEVESQTRMDLIGQETVKCAKQLEEIHAVLIEQLREVSDEQSSDRNNQCRELMGQLETVSLRSTTHSDRLEDNNRHHSELVSSHDELLALCQTLKASHADLRGRMQSEAEWWTAEKQEVENMCNEKFSHVVVILERFASEAEADRKEHEKKRSSLRCFVETNLKALNDTVYEHKSLWEERLSILEPRVDTDLKALNDTVQEHKDLWEARLNVLEPRVDMNNFRLDSLRPFQSGLAQRGWCGF